MESYIEPVAQFFGPAWPLVWSLLKIIGIIAPLFLCVAYLTLAERKVIGYMQVRIGPNRVGPYGLLQPIADGMKLLIKEDFRPKSADRVLFTLAPLIAGTAAFSSASSSRRKPRPAPRGMRWVMGCPCRIQTGGGAIRLLRAAPWPIYFLAPQLASPFLSAPHLPSLFLSPAAFLSAASFLSAPHFASPHLPSVFLSACAS